MGVVPGQVWEQQGDSCVLPSGMGGRVPWLAEPPPRHGHSTGAPRGCSWTSGLGAWLTRNILLCARSAQAGPSSPWPSLRHSRASLRGRGIGCGESWRRDAELSISNEGSPALGHHEVPAGLGALGPPAPTSTTKPSLGQLQPQLGGLQPWAGATCGLGSAEMEQFGGSRAELCGTDSTQPCVCLWSSSGEMRHQ